MSNHIKCEMCEKPVIQNETEFHSGEKDVNGSEIIIPNVTINYCTDETCGFSWLPISEEERINDYLLRRTRHFLSPKNISLIRQSLGFSTKTAASNFLTLNSKAFTKWENGYTEPNTANDLLLRLAVFSEKNFNFIKDLADKKFMFVPEDYELICKLNGTLWNYQEITVKEIESKDAFEKSLPLDAHQDYWSTTSFQSLTSTTFEYATSEADKVKVA